MRVLGLIGCVALAGAVPAAAATAQGGGTVATKTRVRVVAVQMRADARMYRDRATFAEEMARVVGEAARRKAATCPTLVALPEDTGLGLVFLGHWDAVKDAASIREAGALAAARMGSAVAEAMGRYGVSPVRALLIAANQAYMREAFFETFSGLARAHGVYLAAGSLPLHTPGAGEVRNVAVLFGPDGTVLNQSAKVHLIELEGPAGLDLVPGRLEDLSVARTPFGNVGTAVCYDAFHDDVLARMETLGAEFVLQPSFNPKPWTPQEESDWSAGLWARLRGRGMVGVNPMMVGSLFDVACEGRTNVVGAGAPANGYLGRAASPVEPALVVVDVPHDPVPAH